MPQTLRRQRLRPLLLLHHCGRSSGCKGRSDLEQRVADLEAYVNNGSRGSDAADAKVSSKIDGRLVLATTPG